MSLEKKEEKIVLMDGFEPVTRAFKREGFTSALCELLAWGGGGGGGGGWGEGGGQTRNL